MRPLAPTVLALAALAAAGCGSSSSSTPVTSGWRNVAGMICSDGSPTGIGIDVGSSDNVLVYLAGGGACWTQGATCTATRTFGQADYDAGQETLLVLHPGIVLDRTAPGNPFASWTFVFVPYCTGDVHAGNSVETSYVIPNGVGLKPWNHHGFRNLELAVQRMKDELPRPPRVVVAGTSAGGFGTLVVYDMIRAAWPSPDVEGALLDDSGPTFVGSAFPAAIRTAWWDAWGLGSTIGTFCPACKDDLSLAWNHLSSAHGGDRLGFIEATDDRTMEGYFGMASDEFASALGTLATKLAAFPDAASFRANSPDHGLLFGGNKPFPTFEPMSAYTAALSGGGTITLPEWLAPFATGTGTIQSVGP